MKKRRKKVFGKKRSESVEDLSKRKKGTIPYVLLERGAKAGLTNEQIAFICGVTRESLQKWLVKDAKAAQIVREGKQQPNLKVENSLFRRALGYNVVEVIEKVKSNGNGEVLKRVPILRKHKHVPANVRAIEMWLYNRDPDRWKKQVTLNVRNMSLRDKTELANGEYYGEEEGE